MWSQSPAIVARHGVWQHLTFLAALGVEHQIWIWCSTRLGSREPAAHRYGLNICTLRVRTVQAPPA